MKKKAGKKKTSRRFIKYTASAVFAGGLVFVIRELYCAVMYLYNISVRRGDKTFLTQLIDVSRESDVLCDDLEDEGKRIAQWARDKKTEALTITGYRGTELYGEIFSSDSNKWVIILHGYGGDCTLMYYAGEVFSSRGFNVLIPDLRGHGKSGGSYIGMGWHDRIDIIKWAEEIRHRNKNARIAVYGVSMGGAAAVMASGEKLPRCIKCIIEDCGYTSVSDIFRCQMKKLRIPAFPLLHLTALVCILRNKYNIFKASALKQISKSKLPMLFLHGEKDGFVPPEMLDRLYNAKKRGYKEKHTFKGAGHGVSAMVDKKNYWRLVFGFLKKTGLE